MNPDGATLYAADFGGSGLYRSVDRGETWVPLSREGLGSDRIWSVAIDPNPPGALFVATAGGGLHRLDPAARSATAAP